MLDASPIIHQLLEKQVPIATAMSRLIDAHEKALPHNDWQRFREIDFAGDTERLSLHWLNPLLEQDPPVKVPVQSLFFGLYNPVIERKTVADFYVAGAVNPASDDDWDWGVSPAYFPDGRYAFSKVTAAIYRTAYTPKNGLENDAECGLCLGYVAFVAAQLMMECPALAITKRQPIGVAMGWDSGEPHVIGQLTTSGFIPRAAAEALEAMDRRQKSFDEMMWKQYKSEPIHSTRLYMDA